MSLRAPDRSSIAPAWSSGLRRWGGDRKRRAHHPRLRRPAGDRYGVEGSVRRAGDRIQRYEVFELDDPDRAIARFEDLCTALCGAELQDP